MLNCAPASKSNASLGKSLSRQSKPTTQKPHAETSRPQQRFLGEFSRSVFASLHGFSSSGKDPTCEVFSTELPPRIVPSKTGHGTGTFFPMSTGTFFPKSRTGPIFGPVPLLDLF